MVKKTSFVWSLAIGAFFTFLQVLIFFLRFSRLNTDSSGADYLLFFVGGTLIGMALVYFLRRSETRGASVGAFIGFVIGIPFALFGMLMGGLVGPFGAILFSISPGILFIAVGYFLGRVFSKK